MIWLGVVIASGVGAVLRFLVDGAIARRAGKSFPVGTFGVNISGAALLLSLTIRGDYTLDKELKTDHVLHEQKAKREKDQQEAITESAG